MSHKKTKKVNWRLILAGLCFLVAIVLFSLGPIRTYLIQENIKNRPVMTAQTIKENDEGGNFDFSQVSNIDIQGVLASRSGKVDLKPVGAIAVPDVKINLPIYRGVDNLILFYGAGTMKPDQKMGERNYSLASHSYSSRSDILFTPLLDIKGDEAIYTTDLEYIYEYKVSSHTIVEPTAVEVIDDVAGKTEITLVTCTTDAARRHIIKGNFVKKVPIKEATQAMKDAFGTDFNSEYF